MKLKKVVAAFTAAMLTMSALNLSSIATEEALPSDHSAVQSYTAAHPVGDVLKPVAIAVSEEEAESILQTIELNNEAISNSMPRRASAKNRSSVNHSSSYYYNKLSSAEKQIYDGIVDSLSQLLNSSADILPDKDGYYCTGKITCGSGITDERAKEIVNAVYYSNPQLFFFRSTYAYIQNDDGTVASIYPVIVRDFADGMKRMVYQGKIQSITDKWMPQISALETNAEKEMKIAKLLCDYIYYDWDSYNSQNLTDNGQTIAGALGEGRCVCNGYAMAMAYFCNAFGMDCFLVAGNGHAWNVIDVDGTGTYTEVDVTWMDGDPDMNEHADRFDNTIPNYVDAYWFNRSHALFIASDRDSDGSHIYDAETHKGIMSLPATVDYITICADSEHDMSDTIGTSAIPCAGPYYYISTCSKCYWTPGIYDETGAKPHDFENGELTSDADGHKYICAYGCGTGSAVEEHEAFEYVTTDSESHWKECTVCEYKFAKGEHTYGEDDKCTVCGKEKPVCEHVYDNGKVTKEATCTEKGEKTFTCTICKETMIEEIDMIAHNEIVLDAKEATCKETGLTEGKKCSVCGTVTVEQEEISLKEHTPVASDRVEPTCTEDGMTSGTTCRVCGTILEAKEKIPALNHIWEEFAEVPATCTKEGTTAGRKCQREGCGETEGCEVIKKLPHTEVIDEAVAATCTKTGLTEGKHCSVCETVITEQTVIAALGHDLVTDEAVAATCTEPGLTEGEHCSRCGEILTAQEEIPAKGHTSIEFGRVEPTCTEKGMESGKKCEVCGKITEATVEISALGHDWEEIAEVPATCTEEGTTAGKKCKREGCGETDGCEVIEKLPHTEVIDEAVAATCTEKGLTEGKHCSVCETVITEQTVIAALGHDWMTDEAVAATCTESGLTEGKHCSRCDEAIAQQTVDERGHDFADGVCTVCGTEEVAGCEHIGGDLKKDEAEHYKICTVCFARIEAEAHGYGEFETVNEATCTEAGSRTHSCETCGFVQTEEIPALGHSFADGKCTVCGVADPNYTAPETEVPDDNNSSSASTITNYPVVVPFGYEVKTSEQIADEVSSIAEGDTTEIKLSGNTTLDKSVLEAFAGKDVTVTVQIPGGSYWTINGKDIEKSKKVNLGVRMNRKTISEDRIAELSDGKKTVQFSLKHKGEFGFRGILNVPVNKIYNGKYANLYYDNNGSFEFVGSSLVANGIASFSFTHASDYVIVIDDHAYDEDVSSAAGVYGDEDSTNDGIYVAVISAVALIGTAAVVLKKRKSL